MSQVGVHGAATVKREEPKEAPKRLSIDVTPAALTQVGRQLAKRRAEGKTPKGLRIGLRGGGCDGFAYVFEWADKDPEARDTVFEFDAPAGLGLDGEKLCIFIDKKSLLYLSGTTLNFVTGLMGHGFKFENPNVKGSCGCGESVQF